METKSDHDPVLVFAGTSWQAAMVKSLLVNAGLEAFMTDQIIGTYNPWWTAPGGAGSVSVFVAAKDYEIAREIALEYENNLKD